MPTCKPTCPPTATLAKELNLDHETALKLRKRMRHGFTWTSGVHISHAVQEFMDELAGIGGYVVGAESLYPEWPNLWYLNAGDCYVTTLVYCSSRERFFLRCIGDIIERKLLKP